MPTLFTPASSTSSSNLETYVRDINETPLLTAKEERELAWRVRDGDAEARDHLVRANLRLVVNIARRYRGHGLPLDDLIAEGNLGLIRASETFDPAMDTRFSTYASYWVKQSIRRGLDNTAKMVRVPAYMHDLLAKWRRAEAALKEELGRPPAEEEIAGVLKLSVRKLRLVRKAFRVYNAVPRTETSQEGGEDSMLTLLDRATVAPQGECGRREEVDEVMRLVEELEPREALVLRLRFGLGGEDPMTLKEIGDRLGLTRERARQIEQHALTQLHDRLETDGSRPQRESAARGGKVPAPALSPLFMIGARQ